jgi:uncharacterized protein with gpF-like domain
VNTLSIVKRKLKVKKPTPILYPSGIEIQYRIALERLLREWTKINIDLLDQYFSLMSDNYAIVTKTDAWQDDFRLYYIKLEESIKQSVERFKKVLNTISDKATVWATVKMAKHVESAIGKVLALRATHKKDIKDIFIEKEYVKVKELSEKLIAKAKLETVTAIPSLVKPRLNIDKLRADAKKIAISGIGSINTDLIRDEQLSLGIEEYIWRTVRDEKVRESHKPLDGMICSWKDPSVFKTVQDGKWQDRSIIHAVKLHPGVDYNCRCYPEANFYSLVG